MRGNAAAPSKTTLGLSCLKTKKTANTDFYAAQKLGHKAELINFRPKTSEKFLTKSTLTLRFEGSFFVLTKCD